MQGQNQYLLRWCTKLLALKLAKRLIINYWRCEIMKKLKIGVRQLTTIYDGDMTQ